MRILFIGPLPEPTTGQSIACKVLYDALAKKHEIDLVNLSKSGLSQGLNSLGRLVGVVKIFFQIWQKSKHAEVLYFTVSESLAGNAKDLMIYLICFRRLQRMVIHLHGGAGMWRIINAKKSMIRLLNVFFLKRVGKIIILGNTFKGIYSDYVSHKDLLVIPNFAEDHLFTNREQIESKFNKNISVKLLFLSNLLPGKGHLELVKAYQSLDSHEQKAVSIDFAGSFENDKQRDAFLAIIQGKFGISYLGPVHGNAKTELLAKTHVFCLPTYYPYEGQPISILEAYASGCAVITTDHSGIPDVFSDRQNGILVESRSHESIRSAIVEAISNRGFLLNCALRNLEEAKARFRSDRYCRELEETLKKVHFTNKTTSVF